MIKFERGKKTHTHGIRNPRRKGKAVALAKVLGACFSTMQEFSNREEGIWNLKKLSPGIEGDRDDDRREYREENSEPRMVASEETERGSG